jgi:hypothetical protein
LGLPANTHIDSLHEAAFFDVEELEEEEAG